VNDADVIQDFDDAYELAQAGWSQWHGEADKDLQFYEGAQWDPSDLAYLKGKKRQAWVINRIRRIVKLVGGYERRNRTILKVSAIGAEDEQVASQHSAALRNVMRGRTAGVLSDAFKFGALITGANLVNFWPQGDRIEFARNPHTKFRLDPYFTRRDLKDCRFILRREMITHKMAEKLVPASAKSKIKGIDDTGGDGKYADLATHNIYGEDILPYDEFWRRVEKSTKIVVDRQMWKEYPYATLIEQAVQQKGVMPSDAKKMLDRILAEDPRFTGYDKSSETVRLDVLYGGVVVWGGEDPYGIGDYNFELVAGDFIPEEKRDGNKICGIVRAARDPQTADNRRVCQLHDIFESTIQTGYAARADALVDKDALYQAGQGRHIYLKGAGDVNRDIRQLNSAGLPPGMAQLEEATGRMIVEVTGANEEALGGGDQKDIPALLSKLRQGSALTIFQEEFDNFNDAKIGMGTKLIHMVQAMFKGQPQKVARMISQQPVPNFFDPDITANDITVTEGMETETQRQTAAAHLLYLKSLGSKVGDPAPIPWSAILELSTIELKEVLMKHIKQSEQQQSQMKQAESQAKQLTERAKQARIAADLGRAAERHSQVEENKAGAALNRAKTAAEINEMGWNRMMGLLDRAIALENQPAITKR